MIPLANIAGSLLVSVFSMPTSLRRVLLCVASSAQRLRPDYVFMLDYGSFWLKMLRGLCILDGSRGIVWSGISGNIRWRS